MTVSHLDVFWCLCVVQYGLWGTELQYLFLDVISYKPVKYLFLGGLSYYLSIDHRLIVFVRSLNSWSQVFMFLFLFRYVRLLVHIVAFWNYQPHAVPKFPTYRPEDVTVIVPSVAPFGEEFEECIRSVLRNSPGEILVVTAGPELFAKALLINRLSPKIRVSMVEFPNKREQVCAVLPRVRTEITVLCDDHVFWPRGYLPHVLAPFEDRNIGAVGTCKRVRRTNQGFSSADFWNFIGALYLERHNFDCAATSHIDGGVFVISGRTSAHRTEILRAPEFIYGFLHEYCFFGLVGPLHVDDDNFITRWMVKHGWKIAFQHAPGACMETTLGEYPKFLVQCLRWVRTTWRSNCTSLFIDRTVWRTQPWCVYAVYFSSFLNFALFYDCALFSTVWLATNQTGEKFIETRTAMILLGLWIFCSKIVKPFPLFWRNPRDLTYLPGYLLFGYYHSLIKLYALCTFYVTAWGSRPGVDRPLPRGKTSASIKGLPVVGKGLKNVINISAFAFFVYYVRATLQVRQGSIEIISDVFGGQAPTSSWQVNPLSARSIVATPIPRNASCIGIEDKGF